MLRPLERMQFSIWVSTLSWLLWVGPDVLSVGFFFKTTSGPSPQSYELPAELFLLKLSPFYLSSHLIIIFLIIIFAGLGMGCNECTHPSCQHSLNSLGIGQCVECDSGVLVLDPTSGPKWRMACNKCNVVVHFFEHAHRVQVRKVLK